MYYAVVFFENGGFARLPLEEEDWAAFSAPLSHIEVRWEPYPGAESSVVAVFPAAAMEDHVKQALEIVKDSGEVSLPQLTGVLRELFNLRLREAEEVARKIKEVKN